MDGKGVSDLCIQPSHMEEYWAFDDYGSRKKAAFEYLKALGIWPGAFTWFE